MSPGTMNVSCECGAVSEREIATGFGADFLNSSPYVCPDCIERREREEQVAELREQRERRDRHSTVPLALRRDLAELTATARNAKAIEMARAWRDGELTGLLLTGPVGTGKTSIAAAAVWERQLTRKAVWASVPVMLANALRAFDDADRAASVDVITRAGALSLDDLDKVKPSEWAAAQLFAAIDTRVAAGQPLLATMNLSPGALGAKLGEEFGEAIASRLIGYCDIVVVDGDDWRLS